jgi:MerR family transcriptional regulator/heat shock protein HspR
MIGIAAQMLAIHPQTLRLYEREGLVSPKRSGGNTRLYSSRDVERVRFILHLTRDMGVNLAGVEVILRMREQMEEMQREMEGLIGYIREELKREMTRLDRRTEGMNRENAGRAGKKVIRAKRIKIEGKREGRR